MKITKKWKIWDTGNELLRPLLTRPPDLSLSSENVAVIYANCDLLGIKQLLHEMAVEQMPD